MRFNRYLRTAAMAAVASTLALTPAHADKNQPLAVSVNGEGIPLAEVKDLCLETAGSATVSRMIEMTMVDQAAARAGVTVTKSDIDDAMKRLAANIAPKTIDELESEKSLSQKMFEALVREEVQREKILDRTVQLPRMLHLREIVVRFDPPNPVSHEPKIRSDEAAQAIVKEIQAALKAGGSFVDVAAKYSEASTPEVTGDLGIASPAAEIDPGLWNLVEQLKPGQTINPMKGRSAYVIIGVVDDSDTHPADQNAAYAAAEKQYRLWAVGQATNRYMTKLGDDSTVVNNITPGLATAPRGVAATVNGQPIGVDAVRDAAYDAVGDKMLGELIEFRLIDQEARREGITVTKDDIDTKWNEIVAGQPSITKDSYAKQHGITTDILENVLEHRALEDKLVAASIKPATMAHVREIEIRRMGPFIGTPDASDPFKNDPETKTTLDKVLSQLKSGVDFRYLANVYDHTSQPNTDGDIGVVYDAPPFDHGVATAALAMKKGETSTTPLIETQACYLFQIVSTSQDHPSREDAAYADADTKYRAAKLDVDEDSYMDNLRKSAKIVQFASKWTGRS